MKKIILFVAILLVLTGCGSDDYLSVSCVQEDEKVDTDSSAMEASETIFIQLSGEILRPGVYEMKSGARLYEAIELAGGLLDDAAKEINQVQVLSDGQLIHIPSEEEYYEEERRQDEKNDGLIDLNKATSSELSNLPGIGESKANRIISYRESNGPFLTKEDLMNVPGIKEGTYKKLEEFVVVR